MEIHKRIAQRRKYLGLTQEDLARELGITKTNVSRLESGQAKITVGRLQEIARILRTTPGALLAPSIVPEAPDISREEAGVLSLYNQLDDNEKDHIVQLMRLTIKKRKAEEAIAAGIDSLRKEAQDGTI